MKRLAIGPLRGWLTAATRGRGSTWAIALVAAVAGAGVRVWSAWGKDAVWWPDSNDYREVASHGPFSSDFWTGIRAPGAPLLLWLVGDGAPDGSPDFSDVGASVETAPVLGQNFVWAQMGITTVCWALLAASVASVVTSPRGRWLAASLVVGVSWTLPVVMWERSVLTESLSMSSLVLLVAVGIQLLRQPRSWAWGSAALVALAWWISLRDSHAALVLGVAVLAAPFLVWRWRARSRPVAPQHAVILTVGIMVAGLTIFGASQGNRSETPFRNLYAARVLPYEDRVAWFADRGMPQVDEIVRPGRRAEPEPGGAVVVYVADDDPVLEEWNEWFDRHGRSTYLLWAASHPEFVVGEPLRNPERVFNNAGGDRSLYTPIDQVSVPWVTDILALTTAQAIVVAVGVSAWGLWTTRRRGMRDPESGAYRPCFVIGLAAVALAVPHGLLAWHGDAMETARHLAIPVFQLQLGTVLLVVVGALVGSGATRASVAPAVAGGARRLPSTDGHPPEASRGRTDDAAVGARVDRPRGAGEHLLEMPLGAAHGGDDAAAGVLEVLDAAEAGQLPPVAGGAVDEDHVVSLSEDD